MKKANLIGLRIVLALAGVFVVFSGLDIGLGGLLTLGWLESESFFEVAEIADRERYLVQDSNTRFLGGVWTALGLILLLGLTDLKKYQGILKFVFAAIFLGGLARLSQMNLGVTFGPDLLAVVLIELIGMPILYLWFSKTVRQIE